MKTNAAGLELIKQAEGCVLHAYQCEAGKWTIGWGHTQDVKEGMVITQHQADVIFASDMDSFEDSVTYLTRNVALSDNQFSALVSLAYNIGITRFSKSTLLRMLLKGNGQGAAEQFAVWRLADGKPSKNLEHRRALERELFERLQ